MLNHKRAHLRSLEERFRITITVSADAGVSGQQSYIIDRGEQVHTLEAARSFAAAAQALPVAPVEEEEEAEFAAEIGEEEGEPEMAAEAEASEARGEGEREGEREGEQRRRRRRRGRGRGRGGEGREGATH